MAFNMPKAGLSENFFGRVRFSFGCVNVLWQNLHNCAIIKPSIDDMQEECAMMALRKQAAALMESMPEEVIVLLIQQMERYQREQELRAEKKMEDFLTICKTDEGGQNKADKLKQKYGTLTDALSGIMPPILDHDAARERALRDKYEVAY